MLRLPRLLVVVATVVAAPPIPGSTKETWSMDILRRIRIVECGLAVAKSMGGARYRTTPALQNEWAQRLGFDVADFEAITHVGGAGGPRMLWSVAVLRSHAERNAWAQAQRRAHPYLRVLNATSKAHPLANMVRHYDALGLRCEWRLSYGQIAWFLTYLRFLVQVLVADADYGMLLNDDVEIGDDFDRALEALVLRLERPEHAARKYASYRLGQERRGSHHTARGGSAHPRHCLRRDAHRTADGPVAGVQGATVSRLLPLHVQRDALRGPRDPRRDQHAHVDPILGRRHIGARRANLLFWRRRGRRPRGAAGLILRLDPCRLGSEPPAR